MTRERLLAEAFVDTADALVEDFDVIDFLHTLTERCVEILDVDAAGIMLSDAGRVLHAAASSTENARLLELFELQSEAGPCIEAFTTGRPVVNVDLRASTERWPRFAEAAQATGFVSAHALPLRLREKVIGALNLFCERPGALTESDVRSGQALADVATVAILAHRSLRHADLLAEQLQYALTSRIAIEQAKGVLAERRGINVDEAFALLRGHARSHNLRLSDLAREVANGTSAEAELLGTTGADNSGPTSS
ncbi:GAF and ANTAR domain-containing protein [Catenulispora rubra]|uniref:GAF and ANTAR domain-containing protein n=1 Tax=Catenulispora rubra TaxID=280293 RepID=UPI0018920B1D|nr:GAF and ANTAR domain-containing protein [Catenulispora rubra]